MEDPAPNAGKNTTLLEFPPTSDQESQILLADVPIYQYSSSRSDSGTFAENSSITAIINSPIDPPSYEEIRVETYELELSKNKYFYINLFISKILTSLFLFSLYFIEDLICELFEGYYTWLFVLMFGKSSLEPILIVSNNKVPFMMLVIFISDFSFLLYVLCTAWIIFGLSIEEGCTEEFLLIMRIIDPLIVFQMIVSIHFSLKIIKMAN